MELLIKYLGAGKIEKHKKVVIITIVNFSDIIKKIIPLFENNSLHGVKQIDFLD
jgi:LAGLIDADG endonuclease